MPKLKKTDLQRLKSRLPQRDIARAAAFVVVMTLAGLATHSFIFKSPPPFQPSAVAGTQQLSVAGTVVNNPSASSIASSPNQVLGASTVKTTTGTDKASFTPVAPTSKPELGKYTFGKTSYDNTTDTYRYVDTITNSPLTVSEQQLASGATSGQAAVDKVAASIKADQQIFTNAGTAYMYSDQKTYAQTLVFSLKGLLISINSNFPHSVSDWQKYINALN